MQAVLIVDDEPHISRVTRHCLERAGYEVEIAPDGREALEMLEWREYDAVVTDIMMPRMGGRELCEEIRKRWPERRMPIFVITSSIEQEHREWAQDIADSEFLEKPVSMQVLTSRLRAALDAIQKPGEPT